jgi:hypothetical protein
MSHDIYSTNPFINGFKTLKFHCAIVLLHYDFQILFLGYIRGFIYHKNHSWMSSHFQKSLLSLLVPKYLRFTTYQLTSFLHNRYI